MLVRAMPASRRRLATALVLLMIFAPFASAGVTNWTITTPINPDDDGVTTNAFSVPSNETIVDGWISVNSNPMASSNLDSISISGDDFDNGTYDGATGSVLDGNLTMYDDGSTSSVWNFDDNGNFTIAMADDYHSGPGEHLWQLENPIAPSTECGDLLLYNLSSGFDLDFDLALDDDEITSTENLCQTNMTIENGTGQPPAGDVNGTVQNSTVTVMSYTLTTGDSNCPYGGTHIIWGNDYSIYYDKNTSLNASEIEGEFYFCNGQEVWFASLLDFGGTIVGDQQQLAHGVVPSAPSEGEVVVGTLPGQALDPGTDAWLLLPSSDIPANPDTHVNYSLSFDHWHDVESGDGLWVEHRLRNGSAGWGGWTWTDLESGYTHSISMGDLDVSGTPSSSTIPVFGGDAVSGWVSSFTNLSNITDITTFTEIQFRFRVVTALTSTGSAGWFLDNINYHNDGDNSGAWHHGCDVNGYAAYMYTGYCYYGHNKLGYLTYSGLDLTGATDIEFDLHWDLEGSGWDNACIELSNNNGGTWIDITSTSSSTSTQCRSRSGAIPGYGYSDMDGNSYGDDSGGLVTIKPDVPTAYQVANITIRFVVQTDSSVGYGSPGGTSDPDGREGLTVFAFRPVDSTGATLYSVFLDGTTPTTPSGNEWRFLTLNSGYIDNQHGFEDSAVTEPESDDMDGFTRTNTNTCSNSPTCGWDLTPIISDDFGPSEAASFPYLYAIGAGGSFQGGVQEASLITPNISVPESGISFFTFEMWMCWSYNNWQGNMHGGALMVQVDGGAWELVNPGWYSETMSSYSSFSYIQTNLDGMPIWTDESCGDTDFTSYEVSMAEWAGSDVKFKFIAADKYGYGYSGQQGWFIDNVGVRQGHFSSPGDWISQPIELNGLDSFNLGIVEIEGKIDDNSTVTGSIIDAVTEEPIIGFESLDFPINLAGLDSETHPIVKVRLELSSSSTISTPIIRHVEVGGPRILSAELFDFNGWNIPSGVEVIDDLLNATAVTSTITSEYLDSIRPIKRINFLGNASNNVLVAILDENGNDIANNTQGGYVSFTNPIDGYGIRVTLPPNGFIDEMWITPVYAEPARDVAIDVAEDDADDWDFPYSNGRGHLGWQTTMLAEEASSNPNQMGSTSLELSLTSGVQESLTILIPDGAIAHSGLLAITSDSDGFDSSINIGINGYQKYTSTSDQYLTYFTFSPNQVASISAMGSSWTDTNANSRDWKEVDVTLESSTTQTVTLSRLAISYSLYETVSDLTNSLAAYHTTAAADNPGAVNINIPTNITAPAGQISINGQIEHELMIKNKDFNVPQVFYPDGTMYEIVTIHRHLYDNSELQTIQLDGHASDGETVSFEVSNSDDDSWGMTSGSVTFSQTSGSQLMSLDTSASEVSVVDGGDGWMEVQVTWKFDVSWNWNDVDRINWIAQALDSDGASIWPANSVSGIFGNAVENDLQIDSFEIRDQFGRLVSNQFSTFYPFPILEGSDINVTGSVRFQNSLDTRPMGSDFQVRLNLSGSLLLLDSYDDGVFSGTFSTPTGLSEIAASPQLFRIGPLSGSIGGEDTSGQPPIVVMVNDYTPPTAGPLQVMTPSGLQNANGAVWDPSQSLSLYVTVEEPEARGETLTMHYWRADMDDLNSNGIAEVEEYLSQVQLLSTGMTGEQQVSFAGIDVSGQSFNGEVHIYLEGTDWAGLTYQEGGTGGGPGADNSWASVIVATDEPTEIVNNGFNLDRKTGYLLAGVPHTFTMQISEPNGLQTLDNITIMLCGDRLDDSLGEVSYNPGTGEIWTADDSMVSPLNVQTTQITQSVIELAMTFELSWEYPWEEGQFGCKPSVSIVDDITEVAYLNNIGDLTWVLDNSLVAVASGMSDLTPPIVATDDTHLFLRQGDEFGMTGGVFFAGSGEIFTEVPDDLQVEMTLIYGTKELSSIADVSNDGQWYATMTLLDIPPYNPTMNVTTTVLNVPGSGTTSTNINGKITVDSKSPTVLFDQINYPDSSLTVLESDLLEEVLVSLIIVDEIGMPDSDLEVAWVYLRDNQMVAGTEDTGTLALLLSEEGREVFQGKLDLTPMVEGHKIQNGDRILFWVTSTDKSGNEIQGLGSQQSPRAVALRVMEFNPSLDNVVVTPKDPLQDTTVVIETYWSNSGKRDGTIEINLYELTEDGKWVTEQASVDLELSAETSSVYAKFEWVAGAPGQPVLYIIVDDDFDNPAHPVSGLVVQAPIVDDGTSEDTMVYLIMGGVFLVAVAMVGFFVSRSRSGDDEYYYDDEDSYYEEDYEEEYEEYEYEDDDQDS